MDHSPKATKNLLIRMQTRIHTHTRTLIPCDYQAKGSSYLTQLDTNKYI